MRDWRTQSSFLIFMERWTSQKITEENKLFGIHLVELWTGKKEIQI